MERPLLFPPCDQDDRETVSARPSKRFYSFRERGAVDGLGVKTIEVSAEGQLAEGALHEMSDSTNVAKCSINIADERCPTLIIYAGAHISKASL